MGGRVRGTHMSGRELRFVVDVDIGISCYIHTSVSL